MITVAKEKRRETAFGARLRALREAAGLTQAELAEQAGMLSSVLARLERGEREPQWSTVLALASALDVSTDAFKSDEE